MLDQFARTELLMGREAHEHLCGAHVAVFGVGGVGGYAVEALARSGVGHFTLVDDDKVCVTNINRQIIATHDSIGKYKVDAARERIAQINPKAQVDTYKCFYLPQTADQFDFTQYDYVVDAVDTVSAKLSLVEEAHRNGTPIISSMGAGNKLDPTAFEVADIYDTSICPLARVMRKELRKRGIPALKVVYSKEPATRPVYDMAFSCRSNCVCPPGVQRNCLSKRDIPGSTAWVPSVVGLIVAGQVAMDIAGIKPQPIQKM